MGRSAATRMVNRQSYSWLGVSCFALLVGAGQPIVSDARREAYQAFRQGNFELALKRYDLALSTTPDPGAVAFDQGATLAALGRHAESALAFGRCMEDAAGLRRIRAAYGQGTAMIAVAARLQGKRAVKVLQQAILLLEIALREGDAAETNVEQASTLRSDAGHNRTIAQQLLAKKLREPEPPVPQEEETTQDPMELLSNLRENLGGNRAPQPLRPQRPLSGQNGSGTGQANSSNTQPGRGSLPPVLDDQQTPPFSPEEAREHLEKVMQRLRKPLQSGSIIPGARDW